MSKDKCKYMRTKYNWTPNDYDIYFDPGDIPANIKYEDSEDLLKYLNIRNPVTKVLHLNLDQKNHEIGNYLTIYTNLTFTNNNDDLYEAELE